MPIPYLKANLQTMFESSLESEFHSSPYFINSACNAYRKDSHLTLAEVTWHNGLRLMVGDLWNPELLALPTLKALRWVMRHFARILGDRGCLVGSFFWVTGRRAHAVPIFMTNRAITRFLSTRRNDGPLSTERPGQWPAFRLESSPSFCRTLLDPKVALGYKTLFDLRGFAIQNIVN